MNMYSEVNRELEGMSREFARLCAAVQAEMSPPVIRRTTKDVAVSVTNDDDIIDVEIVED